MADRLVVPHEKIREFRGWLENRGWKITLKGGYWSLWKASRPGDKTIVVWFRKDGSHNYSVDDQGAGVVREFKNWTIPPGDFCESCGREIPLGVSWFHDGKYKLCRKCFVEANEGRV